MSKKMVPVSLHQGEAIIKLANTYRTLMTVVYELVQNALDVGATQIEIKINQATRFLAVRDNGSGVSDERFYCALQSIAKGIKEATALGRFGLGLVSPLGKCREFTFTSCSSPLLTKYLQWTFNTDEIQKQKAAVEIPMQPKKLRFDPDNPQCGSGSNVWWRTEVAVFDFTADKSLSEWNVDEVVFEIQSRFGRTMEALNTVVTITTEDKKGKSKRIVQARGFTGRQLKEFSYDDPDAGHVEIRMYVTPVNKRKSARNKRVNILFGEMDNHYRFLFSSFARSHAGKNIIADEVMEALGSGLFEGEIVGEKVVLRPARNCFEPDDALVGLCIAIEKWYEQVGAEVLDSEKCDRQAVRYQDLGRKVLKNLSEVFRNRELWTKIQQLFPLGTVGSGHKSPDPEMVVGEQDNGSKAPGKKHAQSHPAKEKAEPKTDKPGHVPTTVAGPKGRPRTLVRGDSVGLQLAFDDFAGSSRLWRLDREQGILSFNITHPDWVACDVNDRTISKLMAIVAMLAVNMLFMDEENQDIHRQYIDTVTPSVVSWLIS